MKNNQILTNYKFFYAGIGSRKTPSNILKNITQYAARLEKIDFVLRSDGAKEADLAFEKCKKIPKIKKYFILMMLQNILRLISWQKNICQMIEKNLDIGIHISKI